MNLLIVDDHATNRKLLRTQLEADGHAVFESTNGSEALQVLEGNGVDGVISDILMPVMDGFRLCLEIRNSGKHRALPFVLYTSTYNSAQDRELAQSVGADSYVTKPAPVSEIVDAVRRASARPAGGPAPAPLRADEAYVLKQYNETLVRKLEERNTEIETALAHLKSAYEEIRAAEAKFRALIENGYDAISMLEKDGTVLYRSPAASRILGYSMEAFLGQKAFDLVHPDDLAAAQRMFGALLADPSRNVHGTIRYRHQNGEWRWLEGTGTNLLGHPAIGAIVVNHRDVTGQHEAEEAGRESETRFRQIAENIREVFWLTDPSKNQMLYVSPAYESIWGRSRDSLQASPRAWADAIHPDDRERVLAAAHTRQASGDYAEMYRIIRSDGTVRWIRDRAFPVLDRHGRVVRIAGIAEDITEQKLQEERIEKLSRIRSLSSEINAAIVRCTSRQELFDAACRIAVEQGRFGIVWIGRFDPHTHEVASIASAGLEGSGDLVHAILAIPERAPHERSMLSVAIGERRPVYNNDIAADAEVGGRLRQEAVRRGYRSAIALPLIVGGEVFGNLSLFAAEPEFFDDQELALLTELAGNISFALDGMARQEKLDKLSRIRAVSSQINELIVRSRSRQNLFDETCRIAVEHGGFGIAWIGALDGGSLDITPVASAGLNASEFVYAARSSARDGHRMGQGVAGQAVRERRAVFANDILAEGGPLGTRRSEAIRLGYRSRIALPLLVDDRVAGIMVLYAVDKDFFNDEELKLLDELAGNISLALESMAQRERVERLSRIRNVTSEINSAIVRSRNKQSLYYEACRIAVQIGGFGIAWIGELDSGRLEVSPVASSGLEDSSFLMHSVLSVRVDGPHGAGVLSRAVCECRVIFNNDITVDPEVGGERRKEAIRRGFRSVIVLPLIVDGAVTGTFSMFIKESNYFDNEEVELLTELGGNLSFALDRMAKQQKLDKLSRIRAVSSGINELIVRVHERDELLREVCRIAVDEGKFAVAWAGMRDPAAQRLAPVAWVGQDAERLARIRPSSRADAPYGIGVTGRAMQEKAPVWINDVSAEPDIASERRRLVIALGFRSNIGLPLLVDGSPAGVLTLYAREANFFDDEEVGLLTELAANVSFALHHIANQEKLEKLSRVRAVSGEVNAAIVRVRDREALFRETCRIASEHGKFPMTWMAEVDAERKSVRPTAWTGFPNEVAQGVTWEFIAAVRGTMIEVVETLKMSVRNRIGEGPRPGMLRHFAMQQGCQSSVTLPLIVEERAVGVIALFAGGEDFFDDEELALLQEVAADLSFALESLARQEKVEKLSRMRDVMSEINAAIVRIRDRQELFVEACRIAAETGRFPFVWAGVYDRDRKHVRPVAWAGAAAGYLETMLVPRPVDDTVPLTQGLAALAVSNRKAVIVNDVRTDPRVLRKEMHLEHGTNSLAVLPLVVSDDVAGIISLHAGESGFFDDEEVRLLFELAGDIALALQSIARQEKVDKLSRIRDVMSEINAAIVRIRDRQELFQETCRIAAQYGRFKMAWVGTLDHATLDVRPVASIGLDDDFLKDLQVSAREELPEGRGIAGVALRGRHPVCDNDNAGHSDPHPARRRAAERGARSAIAVPFLVDGEADAILVLYADEPDFFTGDEVSVLTELAADVSFGLQSISKQDQLDYLSYYDSLTGLPNRALFLDRLGQQLHGRSGDPAMVALILLDVERVRYINETLGRHAGDELLKMVACRLEDAFHGKEHVARLGGDGFGVVVRGVREPAAVVHVAEDQALECFREPFMLAGTELRVSARAGIAVFPADGGDADTLFKNAEAALDKARESGERYLFYAAEMNAKVAHTLLLESRLRKAVEARQFVLHYQPKIALPGGAICGLEALIRWQQPDGTLVPPGAFIPLLEETGMILEVGKWAIARALTEHREWTACGCVVPRIAVNVSSKQLERADFVDTVVTAVQDTGDNPDALELEITESLLMHDVQASINKLSILREMGIHIAMDDFGTGFSSLSYLARLPINSLKIDRSFVNAMAAGEQDLAIVSTIIALAHSLRLKVIAEGVETGDQAHMLASLTCDEAQGFLYSKPRPAAEIEALLRAPTAAMGHDEKTRSAA